MLLFFNVYSYLHHVLKVVLSLDFDEMLLFRILLGFSFPIMIGFEPCE